MADTVAQIISDVPDKNGNTMCYESDAERIIAALEAHGYRIVHPERMLDDCPDRWACCIHTAPENP